MFDLEKAIASWRQFMTNNRAFVGDDLDELESHVRHQVAGLQAEGLSAKAAYRQTMGEMGDYGTAEAEYRKVYWGKLRHRQQLYRELRWRLSMFRNYVKIALRNLKRQKGYAFINITGLAVGMACCLLIALYVGHEHSYDRFHEKADRIYRVLGHYKATLENDFISSVTDGLLAPTLQAEIPEVQQTVRIADARGLYRSEPELPGEFPVQFEEEKALWIDASVFEVFSFSLLRGDPATALVNPFSVVLTQEAARRYFGDTDPMGRTLRASRKPSFYTISPPDISLTVTGILDEVPSTSHFTFDLLLSMRTVEEVLSNELRWMNQRFMTYVLLPEGYDPALVTEKMQGLLQRHAAAQMAELQWDITLSLQPLKAVYLHSDFDGEGSMSRRYGATFGNRTHLYLFSGIALFILFIACINFINLSTARSAERAREIGIRKVAGAYRSQLIMQFLSESVLLTLCAVVLALLLAGLFFPAFRALSDRPLSAAYLLSFSSMGLSLGVALVVGVLAGIYPAVILARFQPAAVLKGTLRRSGRGVTLRQGLVVFQFGLSILLIAATAVVFSQLNYMRSQDLGFAKEQTLVIDFKADEAIIDQYQAFKDQLMQHPAVTGVVVSSHTPGNGVESWLTRVENPNHVMQDGIVVRYTIDDAFMAQYGLELVAGRSFSPDHPSDGLEAMILNETAVQYFGYASPEEVLGKPFWQLGKRGRIIGVVKDFHMASLGEAITPLSLRLFAGDNFYSTFRYFSLQIKTNNVRQTVADLKDRWESLAPERPFDYSFLDATFDAQYRAEERFGRLFGIAAGLAIVIACLGLLGLASYTMQQRTKEVGIRKVLGASVSSIVLLFSKDFLKLVVIAYLVAVPVIYLVMSQWLENFAYRIEIGAMIFVITLVSVLVIAWLSVSYQAFRAARANPVQSLKYE